MPIKRKHAGKAKSDRAASRLTGAERVRRYREKQRASGLRPIQMWVWDTRNPKIREQIKRECELLRNDPEEKQILQEIEAVADISGWK